MDNLCGSILRAADQAMYAAKEAGRDHILSYNQIQLAEEVLEDSTSFFRSKCGGT